MSVHVIGASGRSGTALVSALLAAGTEVVPVVRNLEKWRATGLAAEPRLADIENSATLRAVLADGTSIISCAHARHAAAVLAASPADARHIFLGSTRKFTRWPDAHGNGVLAGEAAFLATGRSGVMLHPTMIYGAAGENNVQRLAAILARLPVLPLPDGGRARVQPIHQDDVTRAILAALAVAWNGPHALTICGPEAVTYAQFATAVAAAARLRRPRLINIPASVLIGLATITKRLPGLPRIHPEEIRRLLEDKAFDPAPFEKTLGFIPISLEDGLARTFAKPKKT